MAIDPNAAPAVIVTPTPGGGILARIASVDPKVFVAAGLAAGVGLADAWHFRTFGMNLDVALLSAALTGLGLHVATN